MACVKDVVDAKLQGQGTRWPLPGGVGIGVFVYRRKAIRETKAGQVRRSSECRNAVEISCDNGGQRGIKPSANRLDLGMVLLLRAIQSSHHARNPRAAPEHKRRQVDVDQADRLAANPARGREETKQAICGWMENNVAKRDS